MAATRGRRGAKEHGRRERGVHLGDRLPRRHRHSRDRLAALPRAPARHAQLPPVVRRAQADAQPRRGCIEPGDLVHGRAARNGAVRPDPDGVRGHRRVADDGDGRRAPWTRASRRTGTCSIPAPTPGRGSSTRGRREPARRRSALLDVSDRRRRTRSRAASSSARSSRLRRPLPTGPTRRGRRTTDVARLQQIFPTGVCDYSKPDVGRPPGS